jgi:hypothetical protein
VEAAARQLVDGLGTLRGAQVVLAASLLVLARDLDSGPVDERVARELRLTAGQLVGLQGVAALPGKDPVRHGQDEIARKRAQHRGEAG